VLEITRAFSGDIHVVEGREVLRIREEAVPLIRIDELLDQQARQPHLVGDAAQAKTRSKCFVIVVSVAERKFGLVVEKLVGEEELVIKALEDHLVATDLVGGASVLGNGRVVLILNLAAVVDRLRRKQIPGRARAVNA
jgi:two-component system chemotaxis sensor kinase CheA